MRRLLAAILLVCGATLGSLMLPGAAHASSNMPQMDFSNPLNLAQVVWLVIILVALYFILANWALPGVGAVLADRAQRIQVDLDAAHSAKAEADAAIAELQAAIKSARDEAQAEVTKATEAAKAEAARQAEVLARKLARTVDACRGGDRVRPDGGDGLYPPDRHGNGAVVGRSLDRQRCRCWTGWPRNTGCHGHARPGVGKRTSMEYEALSTSPFVHGAFWVLVAVLIFIVLFGVKIAVPLGKMLDNRADLVRQSLDEAAKLKSEAEAMLADAKKKRVEAIAEARDILARAHEEAARTAAELAAEAEMRAHARERMVEERIQSAQASAIAEVRSTAVDVAIAATIQALRDGLTVAEDGRLVDHAIAEVPSAFTRRAA